jgi:hypothetical protein
MLRAVAPARARILLLAGALAAATGCAGDRAWKVAPEAQHRFDQSRDACEKLTDEPDAFDKCLRRRGWRRERAFGL